MENINWLSVIIAALVPMVTGMIYYHPKLFGTAWMNSLGLTEEECKNANKAKMFGVSLIMAFLLAFFLVNFNNGPGQEGQFDTFQHGAFHGFFLGVFFAMPLLVTNGLFELRNFKNLAINTLYWMITLAIMGGIVDVMNHWPNEMVF
jgi:hypothetical protein